MGSFQTGEQWNRNPCTLCVCIGGTVVCTVRDSERNELIICSGVGTHALVNVYFYTPLRRRGGILFC